MIIKIKNICKIPTMLLYFKINYPSTYTRINTVEQATSRQQHNDVKNRIVPNPQAGHNNCY